LAAAESDNEYRASATLSNNFSGAQQRQHQQQQHQHQQTSCFDNIGFLNEIEMSLSACGGQVVPPSQQNHSSYLNSNQNGRRFSRRFKSSKQKSFVLSNNKTNNNKKCSNSSSGSSEMTTRVATGGVGEQTQRRPMINRKYDDSSRLFGSLHNNRCSASAIDAAANNETKLVKSEIDTVSSLVDSSFVFAYEYPFTSVGGPPEANSIETKNNNNNKSSCNINNNDSLVSVSSSLLLSLSQFSTTPTVSNNNNVANVLTNRNNNFDQNFFASAVPSYNNVFQYGKEASPLPVHYQEHTSIQLESNDMEERLDLEESHLAYLSRYVGREYCSDECWMNVELNDEDDDQEEDFEIPPAYEQVMRESSV
jgi:hypothetical protein